MIEVMLSWPSSSVLQIPRRKLSLSVAALTIPASPAPSVPLPDEEPEGAAGAPDMDELAFCDGMPPPPPPLDADAELSM